MKKKLRTMKLGRWEVNQYLQFKNRVAKITNFYYFDRIWFIQLRCFSYGKTDHGYEYGTMIKKSSLDRMFKEKKVKSISPLVILELLLNKFIIKTIKNEKR